LILGGLRRGPSCRFTPFFDGYALANLTARTHFRYVSVRGASLQPKGQCSHNRVPAQSAAEPRKIRAELGREIPRKPGMPWMASINDGYCLPNPQYTDRRVDVVVKWSSVLAEARECVAIQCFFIHAHVNDSFFRHHSCITNTPDAGDFLDQTFCIRVLRIGKAQ